jgi:hypothetical protein
VYRGEIGGFYVSPRKDYSDWDEILQIYALDFGRVANSNTLDVAIVDFARERMKKKYKLDDGRIVDDLGEIRAETIGARKVVIASRAEPYRIRRVRIKDTGGRDTKESIAEGPFEVYYVPISSRFVLAMKVTHENEKKLNPKWYGGSHARIRYILEQLIVSPR